MKKTIMILCCMWAGVLHAQDPAHFTFGPRLGVNFSHFTVVDNADTKTGLLAGVFMLYSFQEHFGISADLLYSVEGSSYKSATLVDNVITNTNVKSTVNYIRVPIQANLFLGEMGNTVRPKLTLGPCFGFLAGVKNSVNYTVDNNGSMVTSSISSTDKNGYKSVDFGAVIGAGANVRLAERVWLNADARYYIGATALNDNSAVFNGKDIKNQNVSLSLGLGFGLSGR